MDFMNEKEQLIELVGELDKVLIAAKHLSDLKTITDAMGGLMDDTVRQDLDMKSQEVGIAATFAYMTRCQIRRLLKERYCIEIPETPVMD